MKKLIWLLMILLLLAGCTANKVYEQVRQNSLNGDIKGSVTIDSIVKVDDTEINFDFDYKFAANEEGSSIEITNGSTLTKLIYKDGIAFVSDEDALYAYDEYDSLYQLMLPYDIEEDEILDYRFKDGVMSFRLPDATIKKLLSLSDSEIIDNEFNYLIKDDKIVQEEATIRYTIDDEEHSYHKLAEYEYDDISIDLSAFAFLNEDYQQFEGQCIFDNGTSSIINQLEIKDGEVISLHMIQKTHLDVVANLSANVDDYVQQLQVLYDDIVGVKAEVYLEDDAVISDLQIDVAKLDDKALALLDISKDGNELMQKYQAKGYRCQRD